MREEIGDRHGIAFSFEGLAATALATGAILRAARLWGAAERLREEIGAPLTPSRRPDVEKAIAAARASLGADDTTFDAAWREGRAMTLEQAAAYALDDSL